MSDLTNRYFGGILFDLDRVRGELNQFDFNKEQLEELSDTFDKLKGVVEGKKKGMQNTSHWPSKPIC